MKDLNILFAGFGGQGILFAGKVVALYRKPVLPIIERICFKENRYSIH